LIAAVVPVAFFTEEHIDMTVRFLDKLHDEVDRIGVWHNGGTLADEGWKALSIFKSLDLFDAKDMTFYAMWNAGAAWAQSIEADILLVLNNDITWPPGSLRILAEALESTPPNVAAASPDTGATELRPTAIQDVMLTPTSQGVLPWCFAIRPRFWQPIDERYHVWFGDDEFQNALAQAGHRAIRVGGVPVFHPVGGDTTMGHRPGVAALRLEDQALYASKWS
jgi:hypothetical protein